MLGQRFSTKPMLERSLKHLRTFIDSVTKVTNGLAIQFLFIPLWDHTQSQQKIAQCVVCPHLVLLHFATNPELGSQQPQALVNAALSPRLSSLWPSCVYLSTLQVPGVTCHVKLPQNYHCPCRACNTHEVAGSSRFLET